MHNTLCEEVPDFDKVFEGALSDDGGDPVACIDCLWRHCARLWRVFCSEPEEWNRRKW